MPDVKKLITGFLIIVTAASSAAFILSMPAGRQGGGVDLAGQNSGDQSLAGQNAFVPTQADIANALANQDANITQALKDPNNLTTNYTEAFLNGLVTKNPNGIQTDANGNIQLQEPDQATVAAEIANNPNLKKVAIPNWDADVNAQKLTISNTATAGSYNDALNSMFSKNFVQSGVQSLVGQKDLDPSNFNAIVPPLGSAVTDAVATPVPSNLASFHKSLVAMLVYEKNMAALGTLAQTDPVKAAIIYQGERDRYTATVQAFGNEFQKASSKGLLSFGGASAGKVSPITAMLNAALGIETAHAQWITFDPSVFAQFVLDTINQVILQILKNTMVGFIQQRVLNWIQNSGAPRFVQQFGQQLVQVGQAKALSAVSNVVGGYNASCPNIGNLLGPTLANLTLTAPTGPVPPECALPAVSLSQVGDFYKNFNFNMNANPGAGWGLYAQLLNPSNNYYGALLQSQDYVSQQSAQAQQAAQTKQLANNGFSGQEVCSDGSDPNGTHTVCLDKNDVPYKANADGSCDAGLFPALEPN